MLTKQKAASERDVTGNLKASQSHAEHHPPPRVILNEVKDLLLSLSFRVPHPCGLTRVGLRSLTETAKSSTKGF
jgi:hypothetical protein